MRRRRHLALACALAGSLAVTAAPAAAAPARDGVVGAAAASGTDVGATSVPVAPDAPVRTTTVPLAGGVDGPSRRTLDLPVEADHDHDVPAASSLAVLTPARGTADFDLVGVTWAQGAQVTRVLVRTRHAGTWSSWQELEVDPATPEEGTAEAAGARGGTAPLVDTGSDGLQVRLETATGAAPADLSATLVDAGVDDLADAAVTQVADAAAGRAATGGQALDTANAVAGVSPAALRPAIVTRAQWRANERLRKPIDWSSTIQAAVVHHTVNANDYSRAQAPALVRGIYEYHIKGRGWSDVGYHFLVDRFGTVYEGRKGSLDKVPLGVHSGGFNTNTIGIAIIGEFTSKVPSTTILRAVAQVASWKLASYGRDPLGTTVLTARSGSTHPKRKPGWRGSLPVVMGHRDVASTACPGQMVYNRLATIRSYAADQVDRVASRVATPANTPGRNVTAEAYARSWSTWRASVRSVCTGQVVATLTGKSRGWMPVRWNQKLADGSAARPGLYSVTTTRHGLTDTVYVEALPKGGYGDESCGISRWGGPDRYATAVALGRAATGGAGQVDDVVLVAGTQSSIVDGLVAGPFAASLDAPVLLGAVDGLPEATTTELRHRAPKRVWLVGGTGVLGRAVEKQLAALGVDDVRRLAGSDRYGTAAAVAARMPAGRSVVLASGAQANLVDAAAAGGAAAATGQPVLLTAPGTLPTATKNAMQARGVRTTTVVGGTGAVSLAVTSSVRTVTKGQVVRYGGDDRYATALAVAKGFASRVGTSRVVVAAGSDDHLIDSVTAGALARLVVLVPGAASHGGVQTWLKRVGTDRLDVAGGAGAVTPGALRSLVAAI
ncbi:cell wall-binding repeat-containing protein [Cellulomonas palmilytica]|uniref:cell wall-binding repeat-containing protein n=1 Tax=Cellulomonas palmilytica TaxID=2608402 RepID=UPI001F45895F|nr:cell wall-binding repeat-containing protein [Cellulomonas palmilytica]UJP39534.1 cell wall-binding repeat-containing protein [Cellulomonas palmilytica]